MDPYVIIKVGQKTFKTDTKHGAGKTPSWENVFELNRTTEEIMELEVFDHDTGSKDDLVGSGKINIDSICNNPSRKFAGDVKIYYKDKVSGDLFMEIDFYPDAAR